MSAIIRANPSFAAGDLVLQAHQTRVAEDGFVQVSMDFACLATALQRQAARFRMEEPPPVPLPADAAALPLETGNVYLNEIESTAEKGIGYIRVLYVGASLDQKRRPTQVLAQRSFSGRSRFSQTIIRGPIAGTRNIILPIIFDYTAESLTVAWSAIGEAPSPPLEPKITDVRNIQGGADLVTRTDRYIVPGPFYKLKLLVDMSVTPFGPVKRYIKTVTAIAESTIGPFGQ